MLCNLTVIEADRAAVPRLLDRIEATVESRAMFGCWQTVLGAAPRIRLLTRHDPERFDGGREEAASALVTDDLSAFVHGVSTDICATLDCVPDILHGRHGPYYEIRTYDLQPRGALEAAIAGWAAVIDVRQAIAPVAAVFHTLTGRVPRLVHIYPYAGLADREKTRERAIATGQWPPAGGAHRNRVMRTEIAVAAPFSPLG